jgi:DNA mismatch endonuclease (patch repair protein)
MQYQFKTTPARSSNMAAIRASGNRTTELRLRALLTRSSIRGWTLRRKDIPGKPDFFFAREGLAVFVDGCFFHGHARCGHIPRTNKVYWRAKIERNKRRDRKITRELKTLGYRIIRIWECHLRKRPERCLRRILCELARSSAPAG